MEKLQLDQLGRMDIATYKACPKLPMVVILDNIRSQQNVGSIFRTADAYRVGKLVLCGITAQPPHREIHRTALGATESVEWEYIEDPCNAISRLKTQGYRVMGIEQTKESIPLTRFQVPPGQALAVVFGNEVNGISDEVLPLLDGALELPQYGTKHSLNVSVCAGIVIWALFEQMSEQIIT